MDRRDFLCSTLTPIVLAAGSTLVRNRPGRTPYIMTVTGPVTPDDLGFTLPHEHVLVDFIGAERVSPGRYDRREVFDVARPHLERLRSLGGQALFECTPAYLGRDPLLLRELSEATGVRIVTNTGHYGARNNQHLPSHTFTESAEQVAARWIREFEEGIDGTGIRPGFIKIGVDGQALSDIHRKLIRAAALTHLDTGLTIAAHTGPAVAAFDQIEVLREEGVAPSAWVWVHAQGESDTAAHVRAAEMGAWISFDGVRLESIDRHVALVRTMKEHDLLHRVLLSHDAGWYHVGEPGGGTFRPFDTLFTSFIPALRDAGLTDAEIHLLTVQNPAEAFMIRVRQGNA